MMKQELKVVASPYVYPGLSSKSKNTVRFSGANKLPGNIIRCVTEETGISFDQMQGLSRKRPIVIARQMAMYLIYKYNLIGLKNVGKMFNRDHSTVIYSNQTMDDLIDTDKYISSLVKRIKERLL